MWEAYLGLVVTWHLSKWPRQSHHIRQILQRGIASLRRPAWDSFERAVWDLHLRRSPTFVREETAWEECLWSAANGELLMVMKRRGQGNVDFPGVVFATALAAALAAAPAPADAAAAAAAAALEWRVLSLSLSIDSQFPQCLWTASDGPSAGALDAESPKSKN